MCDFRPDLLPRRREHRRRKPRADKRPAFVGAFKETGGVEEGEDGPASEEREGEKKRKTHKSRQEEGVGGQGAGRQAPGALPRAHLGLTWSAPHPSGATQRVMAPADPCGRVAGT